MKSTEIKPNNNQQNTKTKTKIEKPKTKTKKKNPEIKKTKTNQTKRSLLAYYPRPRSLSASSAAIWLASSGHLASCPSTQ
jgi:hypothetical protein